MPVTEFFVKDVRCFAGEHRFRIRPLTLLVGENSTGKSTVLGCMQALANYCSLGFYRTHHLLPDFNHPPYQMGSFREILRKSRPLKDRFEMGMRLRDSQSGPDWGFRITLGERQGGTEPVITRQTRQFPDFGVVLEQANPKSAEARGEVEVKKQDSSDRPVYCVQLSDAWTLDFFHLFRLLTRQGEEDEAPEAHQELLAALEKYDFRRRLPWEFETGIESIAPLRSEPRRTYDPVAEIPDPGGADIPIWLMNLARNNREAWKSLQKELVAFGKESGLFTEIRVRHLGKSGSDPFQLQIKAQGPKVNLIDTGYGVSQMLPILVGVLRARRQMLLVQQPEVHLHPRGQAALASLLVERLKATGRNGPDGFVIETHSDYLIDRTRIEIRRGNIEPSNVSLIYLEHTRNKGVKPHSITFDDKGNMGNAPDSYRQFFLREADRLLGFGE